MVTDMVLIKALNISTGQGENLLIDSSFLAKIQFKRIYNLIEGNYSNALLYKGAYYLVDSETEREIRKLQAE